MKTYSTFSKAIKPVFRVHLRLMRLTFPRFKIGFNKNQKEQPEANIPVSAHQAQLTIEDMM